jgi:hypothetical protein
MLRVLSHHLLVLTLLSALLGADVSAVAAGSAEEPVAAPCCGCSGDEVDSAQTPTGDACPDSHEDGHCPPRCGYCTVLLAAALLHQGAANPAVIPEPPTRLAFHEGSEPAADGASRLLYRPPRQIS